MAGMAKNQLIAKLLKDKHSIIPVVSITGIVTCITYSIYLITNQDAKLPLFREVASLCLPFIAGLAAFYGLFLTNRAFKENTRLSKLQATVSLANEFNKDTKLQEAKNDLFACGANLTKQYLENYASSSIKSETEENVKDTKTEFETWKDKIHYVLNRHEFLAVGIHSGAFDEQMYKEINFSSTMKLWACTEVLIHEIRKTSGHPTLYQDFEILCKRWELSPLKNKFSPLSDKLRDLYDEVYRP